MTSFAAALGSGFRKGADFAGRATRSEYWWFALFTWVTGTIGFGAWVAAPPWIGFPLSAVSVAAGLLPHMSLLVRRLHDTGRSGAYFFICVIPVIGLILLVMALADRGDAGGNAYGPEPVGWQSTPDPLPVG